MNVPDEAVEAAARAIQAETYGAEWSAKIARIALHAAAPHLMVPRIIRTHQERAELKPGTICVDLAGNAWKRGAGSWVGTGGGGPLYDEDDLTLVVLHEPK